ncbi:uncharacterized protein LOC128555352 [Mercenaria mercenaria]|uniref:uncharacterized protein LOC128555352 n=1 Tax=Mercenaria mercenaria TaxID=6596 RepID=UPI00234F2A06|nr:uncharacterized protein LOC128555352 [Mercenaria mercenaria]
MFIEAAIIGIVVGLCSVHAESCEKYDDFSDIVFECRRDEGGIHVLPELSAWRYGDDTEITKKEFVEDIEAYCRNVTPKYKECISGSSVMKKCGNSEDIDMLTTDWVSIYCNGEGIADWLNEYRYTLSDVYSIKEYNEWAKRVSTDWFDCTKDKMPQLNSLYPECKSHWQDALLVVWLSESVSSPPGLRLYSEQISQILALKKLTV